MSVGSDECEMTVSDSKSVLDESGAGLVRAPSSTARAVMQDPIADHINEVDKAV
jgi:hypothetical protein